MNNIPQNIRPVAYFDATSRSIVDAFEFKLGERSVIEPIANIVGRRFRQSVMSRTGVVIGDVKDAIAMLNAHLKRHKSVGVRTYNSGEFNLGHPDIKSVTMEAEASHGYLIELIEKAGLLTDGCIDLHENSPIVVSAAGIRSEITCTEKSGAAVTIKTSSKALLSAKEAIVAIYEHYGICGR